MRLSYSRLYLVALLSLSLSAGTAFAAQQAGATEETYHMHHFSLVLGGSHASGKSGFLAGGEYELRFHPHFGAAFTGEHVGQDFRETVISFTPVVHPWKQLWLAAGPGFDRKDDAASVFEIEEPAGTARTLEKRTRSLFRVGGCYAFEIGRGFTLGPDLAVDFLSVERVFVFGISLGYGFREVFVRH